MPPPAVALSGLRASLDEQALLRREFRFTIQGGTLRLSVEALNHLLPPSTPLRIVRVSGGRLSMRTSFTAVGGVAEVVPRVTPRGRLRLEIVAFQAAGFLPIPVSWVVAAIRKFAPPVAGMYYEGEGLEFDLAELLLSLLAPAEIHLAPLRNVRAGEGVAELQF
jgi:hypothetical protein